MPASPRIIRLADPAATEALGARLATGLRKGDALLLFGELGAGKTTLARGLVAAWTGAGGETPSPTYTLVQTYEGERGELWHFDLYRLESPDDAAELGLDEALETGVAVIEWPERLGGWAPPDRLELRLAMDGEGRRVEITGFGRLKNWDE
ncbi:MAG: tRNA (adenosine(37)-N6)-threonylcarbamoyltransferase complex ATPase subunit type 1 TsaE [Hyphomonadaceae bacterium]|nr:tRNA (adenosine(37)-N6)-threonylcarbamoyltransferase complex ATPase subunit type 1 TsaE [Hyphomonadaceae bacterium]